MKPTDFSKYISDFITRYLNDEKGASPNTIAAYRDTFVLLLNFMQDIKHIKIEKLTIEKITKKTIVEFLDWIQNERKCSNSTRNARLAAIHSFYKYLQYESLDYLHKWHNHPSGNVQPSETDMNITRKIKESALLMDIQLLDHLIVIPEMKYYSMADEGVV